MFPRKLVLVFLALILCFQPAVPAVASAEPDDTHLTTAAQCDDTPKDKGYPRFARLMHDWQWMPWPSRMADPDWHTGFYLDWYPQTVQLWERPKGGEVKLPYNKAWLEYLRELQPNDAAAVWLVRVAAGLFNRGNDFIPILDLDQLEGLPNAQGISAGGNVVKVLQVKNGSARLEMLFFKQGPPNVQAVNYETKPWLVTKFTSISIDGQLGNAGGIDVYFPNLSKQKEGYWVEVKRIEWFPQLPMCVSADAALNLRAAPGWGAVTGSLEAGQVVLVTEYMPQGSDVFGKTPLGWIALEYLTNGLPVYPTSWEMETRPPIDFD